MAGTNRTKNSNDTPLFEYKQLLWGDLIYGTKERLQSIGIAAGMAFPGEPGGPKRQLRVTDPRGLTAKVESSYMEEGIFSVSIPFPGRDSPAYASSTSVFAPGVRKEEFPWYDSYTGTALALVAAGLVRQDRLPGKPGMRKTKVTILPDGSLPTGAPTANCPAAREPGAVSIYKKSKTAFTVHVIAPHAERERRGEENSRAEREWESRMRSLPRPAPLCRLPEEPRSPISSASFLEGSRKLLFFCSELFDISLTSKESQDGFTYSLSDEAMAKVSQHMRSIESLLIPENVRRKATRLRVLQGGKT